MNDEVNLTKETPDKSDEASNFNGNVSIQESSICAQTLRCYDGELYNCFICD